MIWSSATDKSYECGYVVNGQTVHSADYSYKCSVEYNKGKLNYSYYMHTIYRNKSGSVIGTHDTPVLGNTYLYKEELDW